MLLGVSSYLTSLGILIAADNVIQIHSQETTILSNIKKLNTILSKGMSQSLFFRKINVDYYFVLEEDEKRRKEIEKIIAEVNASPYSPINCSGLKYIKTYQNQNNHLFKKEEMFILIVVIL